jgi:hypothetical protein
MALVGALRRCPPLAVLALRRAGRLASHPARTTSISTIYSWWVLNNQGGPISAKFLRSRSLIGRLRKRIDNAGVIRRVRA